MLWCERSGRDQSEALLRKGPSLERGTEQRANQPRTASEDRVPGAKVSLDKKLRSVVAFSKVVVELGFPSSGRGEVPQGLLYLSTDHCERHTVLAARETHQKNLMPKT